MNEGWISFSVDKKTEADEASKSKQRKRSKTTVSIGNMPITSQKKTKQKNTFSQFAGNLYEQVDRVTMGSPLVLLMVNAFMCHIEENWETKTRCLCFLVNTEWNPPPLSVSQWNLRTTIDFPFLEWWLSETVPDQTRRFTGNQLILEFYDVIKAMMKQP